MPSPHPSRLFPAALPAVFRPSVRHPFRISFGALLRVVFQGCSAGIEPKFRAGCLRARSHITDDQFRPPESIPGNTFGVTSLINSGFPAEASVRVTDGRTE
ncbi:hypothetical protein GCM10010232_63590 [Streptomyces amakusaensis]